MAQYIATVHKEQVSDYGVQFYDFPGCITAGVTIEEAHDMANEALTGHIALMVADGDEIPPPSPLEIVLTDPDHQEAIAFLVIEIADNLVESKLELIN